MPRSIHEVLAEAALPDPFTDDDLADLKQEIVRDATETLIGAVPAPAGHFPHDQAEKDLQALSTQLLHHVDAAEHLTKLAHEGIDSDGALYFACLLSLADEPTAAQFWWQFSAGAGNATAAYCLHLLHISRGELRDADHWAYQAATLTDARISSAFRPTKGSAQRLHRPSAALRAAVSQLKVDEVEGVGFGRFTHPDPRLADQIEELVGAL
ncbi:hypothetical protein [Streptomyces sp. NBC_00829]|uniref:hypothetical protein n=1 Tax=Streptomyces sp. NBC_00829 TaxID=2903679 RepID=UPI002F90781C|nr:hypothetical protein OG293_40040 [Streptomyces sp. NBC_00829]